jgi:hypothetical protein
LKEGVGHFEGVNAAFEQGIEIRIARLFLYYKLGL